MIGVELTLSVLEERGRERHLLGYLELSGVELHDPSKELLGW
jgi:hypothetical protein